MLFRSSTMGRPMFNNSSMVVAYVGKVVLGAALVVLAATVVVVAAVVGGTAVPSPLLWFEPEHAAVSAVSARREARLRRVTRRVSHTPLPRLPL